MAVDPVALGQSDYTTLNRSQQAISDLSENFDNFLKLLTTQLQNQDPTEPMDTNEFTNQIVAFSEVEQSVATNENLESLIKQNEAMSDSLTENSEKTLQSLTELVGLNKLSNPAVFYVGKIVEAEGNILQLPATGGAKAVFQLEKDAKTVKVTIKDAEGTVVRTVTMNDVSAGRGEYNWDGFNSGGQRQEEGLYTFTVEAVTESGQTVASKTYVYGRVDGAEFYDGESVLQIGDIYVPLSIVSAVRSDEQPAS